MALIVSLAIGLDKLFHDTKRSQFHPCDFARTRLFSEYPFMIGLDPIPQEVFSMLGQPFYFLGKGAQSYAFISQDRQYVLKFFKKKQLQPSTWFTFFPPSHRKQFLECRENRDRTFHSCTTAYRCFRNACALIFVHLQSTPFLLSQTSFFDRKGRCFSLSLNDYAFILQYRADRVYPYLDNLLQGHNVEQAKKAISSLFELFLLFARENIDHDSVLHKNIGFVGDHAVQIDIGILSQRNVPIDYNAHIDYVTRHFTRWIMLHHPYLSSYVEEKINNFKVSSYPVK